MSRPKTIISIVFLLFIFESMFSSDLTANLYREYTFKSDNSDLTVEILKKRQYVYNTEKATKYKVFYNSVHNSAKNVRVHTTFNGNDYAYRIKHTWRTSQSSSIFALDSKVHRFYVDKDLEIGDTFEYQIRYTYDSLKEIDIIPIENGKSIGEQQYTFYHNDDVRVEYDVVMLDDTVKLNEEKGDGFTRISIEPGEERNSVDYYTMNGVGGYIALRIYKGDKSYSIDSKQALIDYYDEKSLLTPEVLGDSLNLPDIKESDDYYTKAKKIHEFVRDEIRYVAILNNNHSIFPHKPSEVLSRGYGDCKDMAFLVYTLAEKYGVKAYPALLAADMAPDFEYPHLNSYDHVIAVYEIDGELVFSDPTAMSYDFGQVPEMEKNKRAFILNKDNPQFAVIKSRKTKPDADVTIDLNLNDLKNCSVRVELNNSFHNMVEKESKYLKNIDIENIVSNSITSMLRNVSIDYFEIESNTNEKMILTANADMSKFVIESKRNYYFPKMPFLFIQNDILKRDDNLMIELGTIYDINMKINVNVPDKITGDSFAVKDNKVVEIESKISYSKDTGNSISYSICQHANIVDKPDKTAFLADMKKLLNSKKQMYILSKEK